MTSQGVDTESELKSLLDQVWRTAVDLDDDLLKGYVYENRAELEMQNSRFFEAGLALGEAACYLARRSGHEASNAFTRLQNVFLNPRLSEEQSKTLAMGASEKINQQDIRNNLKLSSLEELCEHILSTQKAEGSENED
jgi:hypothetical protein